MTTIEKFISTYFTLNCMKKSCCYFLIIYMKNASQKVKVDKILVAHRLFVICTRITIMLLIVNNLHEKCIAESQFVFVIYTCITTLLLCYMKNAHIFSQSDAHNMYIIKSETSINWILSIRPFDS